MIPEGHAWCLSAPRQAWYWVMVAKTSGKSARCPPDLPVQRSATCNWHADCASSLSLSARCCAAVTHGLTAVSPWKSLEIVDQQFVSLFLAKDYRGALQISGAHVTLHKEQEGGRRELEMSGAPEAVQAAIKITEVPPHHHQDTHVCFDGSAKLANSSTSFSCPRVSVQVRVPFVSDMHHLLATARLIVRNCALQAFLIKQPVQRLHGRNAR